MFEVRGLHYKLCGNSQISDVHIQNKAFFSYTMALGNCIKSEAIKGQCAQTLFSLQSEELWPEPEERSVSSHCPEVQPQTPGRAPSDGEQTGRIRSRPSRGANTETHIQVTNNRVSTDAIEFVSHDITAGIYASH